MEMSVEDATIVHEMHAAAQKKDKQYTVKDLANALSNY